jgi:hypothetical protein
VTAQSECRAHLASILAVVGVPVHESGYVGSGQPPYIALTYGSPYLDPGKAFASAEVGLDVRVVVNSAAGAAAVTRLDDLLSAALEALYAAGVQCASVSAPDPDEQTGTITAVIPTTTTWKA